MLNPDSETALELETIKLFEQLGYTTANCYHEKIGNNSTLGRETKTEVVLISKLRPALEKLNPTLSTEVINLAIEELIRDRNALSLANANREIYKLLKDGVNVTYRNTDNEEITENVQIINWKTPTENNFFLASEFWVSGEMYTRRADLIGFINGIPLLFIELKAHYKRLDLAYQNNLCDYRNTIPQLFWYNGIVILSNGSESRIGSVTAHWEHFAEWKKINSEGEEGIISLDTMIRGTCEKPKLLDIIENFTLFSEEKGQIVKLVAKNHQYLGVNNAIEAVKQIRENQGRLGVFWHTQGSGKSFSMQFFSQKVHRQITGNWTFVVITDRDDLDNQIYKNFAKTGAVTEPEKEVRAKSAEHLKQLLQEDHRYIFTLIQKFRTAKGENYPQLSDREDVIVIADEAHRSQYDTFAKNMRKALPNAGFIGFTGTPLMIGEETTKREFGDYISVYNFKQSIEDNATVPLFYENRIPQLELTNTDLNENIAYAIESANLEEEAETKLEREFSREYHLITRDERLETIAQDIVTHFLGRGHQGKAMVISIDRFTAVKMYNKVQAYWQQHLTTLQIQLDTAEAPKREGLEARINYMQNTDMAVIISQSQNEVEAFQKKNLDIQPHRKRLVNEALDEKFKDPDHPLRIVFVCAMWITGFDVPSCSTIYLDKPMLNHTLMQTIARANRVFKDKVNGLIVDYIGVFRNLQKALAIYGSASGGGVQDGDTPVQAKTALIEELRKAILEATNFCTEREINLEKLQSAPVFERIKLICDAGEAILINEESKQRYFALVRNVIKLYKAILPDPIADDFTSMQYLLIMIRECILSQTPKVDISDVKATVEEILDQSIGTLKYVISESEQIIDLSQIDFEALKAKFATGYQRTEAEKLKGQISIKLTQMVNLNKSRMNYLNKFQQMIDDYNAGCRNIETFFQDLVEFAQELNIEDQRAISENLEEEELAILDLLTKPDIDLTEKEKQDVKKVAQQLLETLKREKLVLDWRKRQRTRAAVQLTVEEILDRLPQRYSTELYQQKCQEVYQHVYDSYFGQGKSIYTRVA
ncbi:Putative type I restriction enzyme HindVIIP R protein [Planktothrix tepida]|uniref:Type I restriction enzyme endonuclease subunit n=1 Tax=Planktothrix tepida PCC 9214 TaxID=671072 RepID=A0A1J1LNP6_9CYAN|nr:type I restriction endonuclease subunit R [Planktothrix tepida]CAD5955319.1 Putative type I restriction enzyme HindVIIP R protein [Planktothrix tepida]CUR34176.1 putative type I restriction enzyme R protein [Planktothrix tepida PCC 9214]